MKRVLIALLVLIAAPAWAEEPTGYQDFPWGTGSSSLIRPCTGPPILNYSLPPSLFALPGDRATLHCARPINLGGFGYNPTLNFVKGQLVGYRLLTDTRNYAELRSIAIEKFGPPTQAKVEPLQTRMGARYESENLVWEWPSGTRAYLYQRFTKIDEAALLVNTPAWTEAAREAQKERIERGKKAF